jgi:translation initiation factor 2 beta subunit (eIF-2beta)/eIF-5
MASPEYLVCLECETPCYNFEWEDGKITEVLCAACGSEDPEQFAKPEDLEEMDA